MSVAAILKQNTLGIRPTRWMSLASLMLLVLAWWIDEFAHPPGQGFGIPTLIILSSLILVVITMACAPYLSLAALIAGQRSDDEMARRVVDAAGYKSLIAIATGLCLVYMLSAFLDAFTDINPHNIDARRLILYLSLFMLVLPICIYSWSMKPLPEGDDE